MKKVILVLLVLALALGATTLSAAAAPSIAGNLIPSDDGKLVTTVSAGQVLKVMSATKVELNDQLLVDEPGNVVSLITLPTEGQLTVSYPYGVSSLTYLYDKAASVGAFVPTVFTQTLNIKVYNGAELMFSTVIE